MVKIDKNGAYRDIKAVHFPKDYDGSPLSSDDLALVEMAFYFPFAKIWPGISVLPACLPPAGHVSDYGEKLAVSIRIFVYDCLARFG